MKMTKNPKQKRMDSPIRCSTADDDNDGKSGMKNVRGEWIVVKQSTDKFYFVWHQKLNYNNFFYIFRHSFQIKWNGIPFAGTFCTTMMEPA